MERLSAACTAAFARRKSERGQRRIYGGCDHRAGWKNEAEQHGAQVFRIHAPQGRHADSDGNVGDDGRENRPGKQLRDEDGEPAHDDRQEQHVASRTRS